MRTTVTAAEAHQLADQSADNARYWTEQSRLHKRKGERCAALSYAITARDAWRRSRYFTKRAREIQAGTKASAAPCEALSKQPVND